MDRSVFNPLANLVEMECVTLEKQVVDVPRTVQDAARIILADLIWVKII